MWRILIFMWILPAQDVLAVDLIAHRGYTCRAVENTARAVTQAWLAKADGVELDLRVSKDGVIVVFHDESVNGQLISGMNYEELSSAAEHVVPTFESILELGRPPGYFVLDLKETDPDKYNSLGQLITEAEIDPRRILVQSQRVDVLTAVRGMLPDAAYYYLADLKRRFPLFRTPGPKTILASIKDADLEGVSLKGRQSIDLQFIKRIKNAGYRVNIWTINSPDRAIYYQDIEVDGLITDKLESIRSALVSGREFEEPCLGGSTDAS